MSLTHAERRPRAAYSYRSDPDVPDFPDDGPVMVFDGECVLCSGSALFVLRHDRAERFRFLAAQSPLGQALYRHYGLDATEFETNILLFEGVAHFRSDAVLKTGALMGLPWSLGAVFLLVPRILRDTVYNALARNRMRVAGRRDVCYVPTPDEAPRFLE